MAMQEEGVVQEELQVEDQEEVENPELEKVQEELGAAGVNLEDIELDDDDENENEVPQPTEFTAESGQGLNTTA